MDRILMAGHRNVFGRWLIHVEPVRMRVIKPEEFETPLPEFVHQARKVFGRNQIISDRVGCDIFRGKRACDHVVLAGQKAAAFLMRLDAGMFQHLPKHFAPSLDG